MLNSRVGIQVLLAIALLLVHASSTAAQTTGRIIGQAVDAQGAFVPGVTVTISGPALQGTRTQVTDSQGEFRFSLVPPGRYMVQGKLTGFKTAEVQAVYVELDRTASLTLSMQVGGVNESIVVTGTVSTIDTTSTTTGVSVGADLFNRIPLGRDFYAAARVAPGTTEDNVGPVVYGSTGAENQYIIDGLNTTGIELGDKGKTLNFDFIQEIEVKTGGLSAEYGRMTGGVINVITKSGSNVFRGSAFGFIEGGGLQANENTRSKRPATTTQVVDISSRGDIGGELGGYLKQDSLWFFGAFNRVNENRDTTIIQTLSSPGAPAKDSVVPTSITRNLYATKFTYKAAQAHTLTLTVMGDPSTRDGNVFTIAGPESTWKGTRETGGADIVGKYEGVVGGRMVLSAFGARHSESDNILGPGRNQAQLIDQTVTPTALSGGFGFFQEQKFTRDVLKGEVTEFYRNHSIKGGIDYEHVQAENNNYNGGAGQRIYRLSTGAGGTGTIYYRHRYYINDKAPGFNRDDVTTWQIAVPLTTEPDSMNLSFYALDSWRASSRLTVNAGIRWEGQNVRSRDRETAFKLTDNWAPRIGAVYDLMGDGRTKIYGNWGRFFESIPMDINIRAFGGEIQCFCYNFSADAANFAQDPLAPRRQSTLGGSTEAVDPDLSGQYIDEGIIGFERDLGRSFVVGAKFTKRVLGNVIEDFLIPSEGEYFIANPGTGIGREMGFYDFEHVAPAPKAQRTSTAFEITGRKRFSNNWQFLASMVFSELEGNYDGTFQVSTGQLDPNINSAFDYADFLVNADGKLSNNRTVQFKLDGSYEFSTGPVKGLNVGLSTHWYSGTPLNAYGYSFAYANWEYYLVPRGSLGTGPSNYEADLQFTYPILLGGNRRLNLQADIFNLFNRQAISLLDERYNRVEDGACGGIPEDLCNHDGGIVTTGNNLIPAGTLPDPRSSAANPDYLKKGLAFTGQRSLRLGVRFLF